ncbi:MAG: branched-chain amino acid ABC transporter permease [Gemmatimonadota bacterium]
MSTLFLGIGFGLVTASVLAISTVALSLQFGVTRVPNFAHGEIMTVGAYAALSTYQAVHNAILAAVAAIAAGAVLGIGVNKLLFGPFRNRNVARLTLFVLTIAASLIIQNVVLLIYGGATRSLPLGGGNPHHVGPFLFTSQQELIIGLAVVIMLGVHLLLRYTYFGRAQRAVAENLALARASGINAARVINRTWLLTGSLAGLAGYVLGISTGGLYPAMGFQFLLVVFAAAILGGIGQPYGAMAGALVVGVTMEVSALYISSDYKTVIAFGLLIAALLVRPQGLVAARQAAAG